MQRPEIVMFRSRIDGKVYAGKVRYNDNWFEEY